MPGGGKFASQKSVFNEIIVMLSLVLTLCLKVVPQLN
jgi:hypothetical protein